jgi:glycerol kinase
MPIVMSIDAGTTGVRAVAVDGAGRTVAAAYREFTQHFPRPGWVEHDPDEIWAAVQATVAEVVPQLDEPVATIGITDQRESIVAWDRRTGRPRHRAIVWQDRRTASRCDELRDAGHLDTVRRRTGLVLDPYFSATKIAWMIAEGGVEADDDLAVGTIDSWLVWCLTGGAAHVTDVTNASRTLLFDIGEMAWSDELADIFGCPLGALPRVVSSSGRMATTADTTALGAGIPISGIAGDQQAALFGQACVQPGMTKNTYGTGSFVLMNVGETCPEPVDGLLTTVAWRLDLPGSPPLTHYALEGAIFVTGAAVQWLRDGLGIISDASELEVLALECDDTDGVVVVPAFTGLGSPWWDPYARGTVLGITRGTGRQHIARAVIESMALQTRDVIDAMTHAAGRRVSALRVDGGASVMDLLLRLQADQIGVPVTRSVHAESTAIGAAYLAGLAEGIWDLDAIDGLWHASVTVEPDEDRRVADELHARWQRGVERARAWEDDTTHA